MPGKYSPELADELVKSYEDLGAVSFACDAVGISKPTFYDWMHRGERGEEPYQSLYFRMRKARAVKAGKLIRIAEDDKGGAMFLLERLFPAEFGANGRQFQDAMQTILDQVLPRLSESAQRELLDAITAIGRERTGETGVAHPEAAGAGAIETEGELVERRQLEPGTE